jgi:anhydro-N-acetylmuramic acid kinase
VVADFRRADVAAGGQGAPLVPLYHVALASKLKKPCAVLNVGGVANLTYIGTRGAVIAFDTGPGNALLNDLAHAKTGLDCDRDGHLARAGKPDIRLLSELLKHPFFNRLPPKSLDRNAFDVSSVYALSAPDAAATLMHFTAAAVQRSFPFLPQKPVAWYVCGGGRHNPAMMDTLAHYLGNVKSCDELGWNGDALEAQAFGFLAVRSLRCLPLSLPSTTGVAKPATGGALYKAATQILKNKKTAPR